MTKKSTSIGPVLRIEVAIHQKLGERKEPKRHCVRQDFPVLRAVDRFLHCVEVVRWIEFFIFWESRKVYGEVALQSRFKRKVWFEVFFTPAKPKALGRGLSLKLHRYKDDRSISRSV